MKVLLVAVAVIAVSCANRFYNINPEEWETFKVVHGKNYKNQFEEMFRRKIFMNNKKRIEAHNAKYEQGEVSYKMKMNHFGDLMSHEIKALMNGFKMTPNTKREGKIYFPSNDKLPKSVDWRQKGAVTPVKDQGQCGSCWSFSATGSLEGQIFLKKGKLVSLSEQNLMDCSKEYGNNGCEGGLMDKAFQYVSDNKGIDTESSYPYEARDYACRFKKDKVGGTDKGYVDIPEGDEKALQNALATVGPISVAIDASHESFHFYSEGVYNEPYCSSYDLDHGVLAVGYGTENGQDYWLVKNSWGPSWGESGYIKIARNHSNHCGIASMASYPIV
uniref:Cathepsin L-like proteinase n=1 Tax=Triatoma brasiliensis TaxID=65344 RepID=G9F9V4_TRIBS|nr:cathepsin L-like proteinase [Triatoma brasiliensis]